MANGTNSAPKGWFYSPNYKWWIVAMLWFICFFNYADRQAISSVLKILEKEFGFSKEQQGYIVSAFQYVYALTAPFAGQVGDNFPRKGLIIGGLFVWSMVTGFTAFCKTVTHFVLVRGAEGLGETFYFPASMSLVSDYHSKKTRSLAIGFHQTSVYAGLIGGGSIAGWMGVKYGWQAPFVFLGGLGVILSVVLFVLIREPKRDEAEIAESGHADISALSVVSIPVGAYLKTLITTPSAVLLLLAFCAANSVAGVVYAWMPTFLTEKFGVSIADAGWIATVGVQVPSMIGALTGGYFADILSRRRAGGRIAIQALGAFVGVPFIYLSGQSTSYALFLIALVGFGFCKGLYDANIWPSLYDVTPAARRATTLGIGNMIGWGASAVLTILIGRWADQGITMSTSLAASCVLYVVAAAMLLTAGLVFAPRDIQKMRQLDVKLDASSHGASHP